MNVPEIIKQIGGGITAGHIICLAGLIIFGRWLLKTSLGRKALADSIPRRNNMPGYLPFIPLFIWWAAALVVTAIAAKAIADLPDWQVVFIHNLVLCIGTLAAMVVTIFLAKKSFARRLKGFGLNVKTIGRDFLAAPVNLLSVWPLVLAVLLLTTKIGQLIQGQDFQIQQHEELELVAAYPQVAIRIMIVITAVFVAPVFEEMLFRGLFQSMIRSFFIRPWLSIVLSSGLFALAHQDPVHWPALFVLGMCLGYAYEKSGSLFRPIFMHAIFNAMSILAALYSG